jgi:hypothetical protein
MGSFQDDLNEDLSEVFFGDDFRTTATIAGENFSGTVGGYFGITDNNYVQSGIPFFDALAHEINAVRKGYTVTVNGAVYTVINREYRNTGVLRLVLGK